MFGVINNIIYLFLIYRRHCCHLIYDYIFSLSLLYVIISLSFSLLSSAPSVLLCSVHRLQTSPPKPSTTHTISLPTRSCCCIRRNIKISLLYYINIYRTNRRYTFPQPHLRLVFFFSAIKPTHASTIGCTMVLSIMLLRFWIGNRDESVIKVNPTNESIVTENNQKKKTFEKN